MSHPRFHLAIPVRDLDETRRFYTETMGCPTGRTADHWVDLDLFGHQLVLHLAEGAGVAASNPVDGDDVPVPHFGVLLSVEEWQSFAERLRGANIDFVIEPHVRFAGEVGEQHTMFFLDPSGNALEFKAFADDSQVFAS